MLAVAKVRDDQGLVQDWLYAAGEDTALETGSIDLISFQFVCHEFP